MDLSVWLAMPTLAIYIEFFTLVISLVAVVYWILLFKRMNLSEREDEGWLWIFASVLMVLLLNLSTLTLSILNQRDILGAGSVVVVSSMTIDFVTVFSRMVMALSLSIGTYKLYESIKARGDMKFIFKPEHIFEAQSKAKPKYCLKFGTGYLVREGAAAQGTKKPGSPERVSGMDLFVDLVTHGVMGLCITRAFPNRVRESFGIAKTPVVWLTKEKDHPDSIHPADLIELSHMAKDYIIKGEETVVILDGVEYLVLHNSFEDVIRLIEGLNDIVVQNKAILIVTIDPQSISEQQYHLLSRELTEYSG